MVFSLANLIFGIGHTVLSMHDPWRAQSTQIASVFFTLRESSRDGVYNILWAVVFGFATLNILSLAARRFEPNRRGLSYGEMLAVLVVLLSIFLLGWELLSVFRIFPIKIRH
jgi:hypothetical protein